MGKTPATHEIDGFSKMLLLIQAPSQRLREASGSYQVIRQWV